MQVDDYAEADRRQVDPPIEVESATWSGGGTLDWWVKERQQWLGRVRGPDSRQTVDQSCRSSSGEGGRIIVACGCHSSFVERSPNGESD
jgi:hypothetical protein